MPSIFVTQFGSPLCGFILSMLPPGTHAMATSSCRVSPMTLTISAFPMFLAKEAQAYFSLGKPGMHAYPRTQRSGLAPFKPYVLGLGDGVSQRKLKILNAISVDKLPQSEV